MEMMARIPCLALYLLYFLQGTQALITKTETGYSGIVVTIHKSVPENAKLLLKTLALFKDSSALLYNVTKGRAFFGEITIVVPMSWNSTTVKRTISQLSDVSYEETYGDYFREADIRIDPHKNPHLGDGPYTLQTGECYERGQYVHLTPEFVIDEFENMSRSYGPRDRNIVHEWMHLRYGIFDEYGIKGDKDFPLFYLEDNQVKISACDRNIKGFLSTEYGESCEMYNISQVSAECGFFPDINGTTAKASIMSLTFIHSVREFCDNETEATSGNRHNSKAPTKQNYYCDGLSVLEVLDRHPDFKNSRKWEVPYVSPKFRVLQPLSLEPRTVLVLDVSSSMKKTVNILNTAGTIFVEDLLPEGSYIGIVTYSTNATTVQELVKINSFNRKTVSKTVPNRASGNTAIGKGLLEAIQVINRAEQPTEGATIVLITDGAENVDPKINEVIPRLVEARVKVNTLAFGIQASKKLEEIAVATKGKTYFFDPKGGVPTADLKTIFADTITIQADVDLQSEQIFRDQLDITDNHQNVHIDHELGNNTLFMVSGEVKNVGMELTSPNGTKYNQSSKEYQKDPDKKKIIRFLIPTAESGIWNVSIRRSGQSAVKVELLVTSAPKKTDQQPIRVHAWLSAIKIQHPDVPRVFARVTKGIDIVTGAEVEATVITPNGKKNIILRDDGSGADKLRNDGIYSAYFIPTKNGRYSVFARVLNSGTALINKARSFSTAQPIPKQNVNGRLNKEPLSSFDLSYFVQTNETEHMSEGTSAEEFSRTADIGSFSVEGIKSNEDKIPPNPVNDLTVLSIDITAKNEIIATLQWTSPGDNMDEGNATYLDIRTSKSDRSLRREHFQAALRINESHVFNDTLTPSPGRTLQKLTILLPIELELDKETAFDVYFALRTADKALNWGKPSNVAVAHYGYVIPEPKVTTSVCITNGTMTERIENDTMTENIENDTMTESTENDTMTESIQNNTTTKSIQNDTMTDSIENDTMTESTSTETIRAKNVANQSGSLAVVIGVSVSAICLVISAVIGWLVYRRRKLIV